MTDLANQTRQAAAREVAAALADARAALEGWIEQSASNALLEQCVASLRQARGALHVLEIHGAALLAEEMEQVGRYLLAGTAERRNQAESLDALMRAAVQLPAYLERVMAGGRDLALVLLPLLNDLRAVRGSALLSEGTLLTLNLRSDRRPQPQDLPPDEARLSVAQWARRMRERFQAGLVGWIRGEQPDLHLENLASVALRMEQVAREQVVFQLWWVVGAVIEALRENGLESSVAVKRLLGLADRELRRLHEQDEARYAQQPPLDLLNNLLYYVARAGSSGPQISAVRQSFRLEELLPVDDNIERERENLSAPSVKLMHTVADAIREDLTKIKEVFDLFTRRGSRQVEDLAPQVELLRKLADTMGVLGLGQLRERVQEAGARLQAVVTAGRGANIAELTEIAAILIRVDDALDDHLVGQIMPREPPAATVDAAAGDLAADGEFRQVQTALLRECAVNLVRIKESVAQNVNGNLDAAGVDSWPELLRGIRAGLLMLDKQRAAEVLDQIAVQLRRVMQPGGTVLPAEYLDRLADAIVSVEYYIETLQAGRSDPWYMLDNAQRCIEVLARQRPAAIPTVPALPPESHVRTLMILPELQPAGAAGGSDFDRHGSTAPMPIPPVLAPPPVAMQPERAPEPADPEMLALYAEEAREELARIQKFYAAWDANPLEGVALETVRRSFHTLKGSGRMVGATNVAEFAWAVENLLNRLLEGTLARSPAVLEVLRSAVEQLPALVAELDQPAGRGSNVGALVKRAHALAAGRGPAAAGDDEAALTLPATALPAPPAVVPPPDAAPPAAGAAETTAAPSDAQPLPPAVAAGSPLRDDHALREIYARETSAHVATVRAWIDSARREPAPHLLTEPVFRACHTLSGSSQMAEARHGIRLAGPLNQWLRKSYDSGIGLDDSDLVVLADCMTAMQTVAGHLDESTGYFVVHETLRARIARAEAELVRRIEEAAEHLGSSGLHPQAPPSRRDYDADVAAIFTEEATELLETAQSAMQDWQDGPADAGHIAALQRALHTLKGGARMAGIAAMADVAHELESLMVQLELGHVRPDAGARATAQRALDELARMREKVAAGRPVPAAPGLVAELQQRARGEPDIVPTVLPPSEPRAPVSAAGAVPPPPAEIPPIAPPPPQAEPEAPLPLAASAPPLPAAAVPPGREPAPAAGVERGEMARVNAELLDQLLNGAGEVSISRARLEQQLSSVEFNLGELARTVTRLKEQLRKLELETEAQILHRHSDESARRDDFDPLELDRYSAIQQYSRALSETTSDVSSLQQTLESLVAEAHNQLQQQARVVGELQNGLMHTRMVPFQRHVQRLTRIVRQAAADVGCIAELVIEGASGELDRQVLERMLPPLEHMLRNAVVHGIELPEVRRAAGKPASGTILLQLRREGSEVIIDLRDDGAGMNLEAIRAKGLSLGLITPDQQLSDDDLMQLVLEPGFSTASALTQQAGRGIGMDVAATEIKKLGGALHMQSERGKGTHFTIRLPLTLAISHALIVRAGDEYFALPLPTIEGVVRMPRSEAAAYLRSDSANYQHGAQKYRLQPLAGFVGLEPSPSAAGDGAVPVVLVRAGEHSTGLVADELVGSREIVVKPVGPLLAAIRGVSGATILSDGRVVVILDAGALLRAGARGRPPAPAARERADSRTFVMVVDDSITVRKVTQRLLERHGMRVLTARDGVEALALMSENRPDILLLDIEMPRMDGYEVAAQVRADPDLARLPIIMITSRVGEKHRARAIELGVNDYLGKPYQEDQLLTAIAQLVGRSQTA